ncbi:hypothetical protein GF369_04500 [Candidatus Peregrinibacteria bacterium]|nr:hypothetical protein [Candidatus Peregrinibacteria bacterium]
MKEHINGDIESLPETIQPIKDKIFLVLHHLYTTDNIEHPEHRKKWDRYIECAENHPEDIKFYITKISPLEQEYTLKTGMDTNEETGEQGFILPLRLNQALHLLWELDPEEYRLLCLYAGIEHVSFVQKQLDSMFSKETLCDSDKAFCRYLNRRIHAVLNAINTIESQPDRDWRRIIQLYFEQ